MLVWLSLSGCAVGPDYQPLRAPPVSRYTPEPLPAATISTHAANGDAQRFLQSRQVPARWWTTFDNDALNRRVQVALAQNPTIASARAALRQAQENVTAAGGGLFPTIGTSAGATRQLRSGAEFGGRAVTANTPFNLYNASINVSYVFDLFGGVRRGIEAKSALADYQRAQLDATYLTLIANVVTASLQEASLRAQIGATEAILRMQRTQLAIVDKQQAIGAKSLADTLAVQTQLATTQATLPPLSQQLASTRNQLATYLGITPPQLRAQPVRLDAVTLPHDIPVSLPSRLVQQRPDIRAASAQLHAATAQVGVATAAMLPQITLSGSLGSAALEAADLLSPGSGIWSIGLNLAQPLFQGGELLANRRAAQAGVTKAVADWQAVVLSAFQSVADALQALEFDDQGLAAQATAEQAAARNFALTRGQYQAGATGYLNLLDAERSYQQALIALIKARAARLSDTAALYAALGGGWRQPSSVDPATASRRTPSAAFTEPN